MGVRLHVNLFVSALGIFWGSLVIYCMLTIFMCIHFLQWIPELKHYAPGVPIVLVGTKLGKIRLSISVG